jgi:hypothetical protein
MGWLKTFSFNPAKCFREGYNSVIILDISIYSSLYLISNPLTTWALSFILMGTPNQNGTAQNALLRASELFPQTPKNEEDESQSIYKWANRKIRRAK